MNSSKSVRLVGLDFGSTTSSALIAEADLVLNCVTGRKELSNISVVYKSEPVFTPFTGRQGRRIDEEKLESYLDLWLGQLNRSSATPSRTSGVLFTENPKNLIAGGAIITGLAAEKENAATLIRNIRKRFHDSLIATAEDPNLESWLAFMGSSLELSNAHPQTPFLNLDIGGGTTNLALGLKGNVVATGSLWVGARHFQFHPGTYKLLHISVYGDQVLKRLKISKRVGENLAQDEINKIIKFYIKVLEKACSGRMEEFLLQAPFSSSPSLLKNAVITFSGGVGELIYAARSNEDEDEDEDGDGNESLNPRTPYGDLGMELARGILRSPALSRHINLYVPLNGGRATVCGLALHTTEISGSTLFLPTPELLPLRDVPIVGEISEGMTIQGIHFILKRGKSYQKPICIQVDCKENIRDLKSVALKISKALRVSRFSKSQMIIFIISKNLGKTLGYFLTGWGHSSTNKNFIVIDEVKVTNAQFVSIGAVQDGVVPVSFYGKVSQ